MLGECLRDATTAASAGVNRDIGRCSSDTHLSSWQFPAKTLQCVELPRVLVALQRVLLPWASSLGGSRPSRRSNQRTTPTNGCGVALQP